MFSSGVGVGRSSGRRRLGVAAAGLLSLCLGICGLSAVYAVNPAPPPQGVDKGGAFTFANVHRRAAELASQAYQDTKGNLPDYFRNLNYDQFRDIRFKRDHALWKEEGLPFHVHFFPRGFLFHDKVTINIIDNDEVKPVAFKTDLFDFGKNPVPTEVPADMGFAGFRLHYPLNSDNYFDELIVFLGASYFRALGQKQNYGITTRGIAINTGLLQPEEFPAFREFWIEKPAKDATAITIYALLDGPSITGAYRFVVKPGLQTVIDVKSHLFMREKVKKLGLAPLTSMFYHGENTERWVDDFRPEVHDSDGLLIESGTGELIWRPLVNPKNLLISRFQTENPHGFGLLQRDRKFSSYEDLEAFYHNRPSAWVELKGSWGKGAVELVQIPSNSERYDNIVAYWIPEQETQAGQEFSLEYRLRYALDPEARTHGGRTIATRIGGGGTDMLDSSVRKFVVDFAGDTLAGLPDDSKVEAIVTTSGGQISSAIAHRNPFLPGWRLFFELTPPSGPEAVDLRAYLKLGNDVLTETWNYQWTKN